MAPISVIREFDLFRTACGQLRAHLLFIFTALWKLCYWKVAQSSIKSQVSKSRRSVIQQCGSFLKSSVTLIDFEIAKIFLVMNCLVSRFIAIPYGILNALSKWIDFNAVTFDVSWMFWSLAFMFHVFGFKVQATFWVELREVIRDEDHDQFDDRVFNVGKTLESPCLGQYFQHHLYRRNSLFSCESSNFGYYNQCLLEADFHTSDHYE